MFLVTYPTGCVTFSYALLTIVKSICKCTLLIQENAQAAILPAHIQNGSQVISPDDIIRGGSQVVSSIGLST